MYNTPLVINLRRSVERPREWWTMMQPVRVIDGSIKRVTDDNIARVTNDWAWIDWESDGLRRHKKTARGRNNEAKKDSWFIKSKVQNITNQNNVVLRSTKKRINDLVRVDGSPVWLQIRPSRFGLRAHPIKLKTQPNPAPDCSPTRRVSLRLETLKEGFKFFFKKKLYQCSILMIVLHLF